MKAFYLLQGPNAALCHEPWSCDAWWAPFPWPNKKSDFGWGRKRQSFQKYPFPECPWESQRDKKLCVESLLGKKLLSRAESSLIRLDWDENIVVLWCEVPHKRACWGRRRVRGQDYSRLSEQSFLVPRTARKVPLAWKRVVKSQSLSFLEQNSG